MPAPSRNPTYLVALALASGVILLLGNLLKPSRQSADLPPSPSEIVRLQRLTQRRALEDLAAFFRSLSGNVEPYVWRLKGAGRSAVAGPRGGLATSASPPLPETLIALSSDAELDRQAQLAIGGPHLLVAEYGLTGGDGLEPAPRPAQPKAFIGEWIIVVWRNDEGAAAYVAGQRLGQQATRCGDVETRRVLVNAPLNDEMLGAGVFDLDGLLLGLVVWCDDGPAAIAISEVDSLLASADPFRSRLIQRYGLSLATLPQAADRLFRTDSGVLITAVWRGFPAEAAGLRPGDVLVEVDGSPISSLEDLELFVAPRPPPEPLEFGVIRRGTRRHVQLPSRTEDVQRGGASGVAWRHEAAGAPVQAVAPSSPAFEAGLRPGDRLLSVNGSPVDDAAAAETALEPRVRRPAYLVVERGDRLVGVLLTK